MAREKKTDGELTWTQNEPSGPIRCVSTRALLYAVWYLCEPKFASLSPLLGREAGNSLTVAAPRDHAPASVSTPNLRTTEDFLLSLLLQMLHKHYKNPVWSVTPCDLVKKRSTDLRSPALLSPEAEDSHFRGYVSKFLPDYTTSYRGRCQWSYSVARDPQIPGTIILVRDDDYGEGDQDDEDGDDDDVRYFNQWIRGFWLNTMS